MRSRLLPALVVSVLLSAAVLAADDGWVIDRFQSRLDIRADGVIAALEAIDVDFRGLSKHGIFRKLVDTQSFDDKRNRVYPIELASVTTAEGRRQEAKASSNGRYREFKIGDPDRTVSGKQTYRIAYTIAGALNAFDDHDELYWNATGEEWGIPMSVASVTVTAPAGAITKVDCFQGPPGVQQHCASRFKGAEATFTATRALAAGEQLTIVVALKKGAVAAPTPFLVAKPRQASEYFERTPTMMTLAGGSLLAVLVGVGGIWWRVGRDRRYLGTHQATLHLDHDAAGVEERIPLLAARPVAVQFEPPDNLRPAQLGLIIDETADTVDVTATIIDLAARGYLTITELPKKGWFDKKDWQLDQLKEADDSLVQYERIVLTGLFNGGSSRELSDLKKKFYKDLERAKTSLYKESVDRGWFPRNPNTVRVIAVVVGILVIGAGIALTVLLGANFGAGFAGLPVCLGGLLLLILASAMPRRTAKGSQLLERTLGFAKYIKTGETRQQAFAERAQIFTAYLPYAIAFKCVDQWARAFKDIDMQAATSGWYVGTTPFNAVSFSSTVSSFSSSMSSAISSTPGGSGSSGFSGGSSGGGGGGGGGGSW